MNATTHFIGHIYRTSDRNYEPVQKSREHPNLRRRMKAKVPVLQCYAGLL